jgi:hypothetical protein
MRVSASWHILGQLGRSDGEGSGGSLKHGAIEELLDRVA